MQASALSYPSKCYAKFQITHLEHYTIFFFTKTTSKNFLDAVKPYINICPVKVTGFIFTVAFLCQWEYVRILYVCVLVLNVYMCGRGA